MKNPSWLRKNWLWVAGASFFGIHFATWILQRAMKSSVKNEMQLKQRSAEE